MLSPTLTPLNIDCNIPPLLNHNFTIITLYEVNMYTLCHLSVKLPEWCGEMRAKWIARGWHTIEKCTKREPTTIIIQTKHLIIFVIYQHIAVLNSSRMRKSHNTANSPCSTKMPGPWKQAGNTRKEHTYTCYMYPGFLATYDAASAQ